MTSNFVDVDDWRLRARRELPRPIFDFVDGGAEDELAAARNRTAWDRMTLLPRVGDWTGSPDLSTTVLGQPIDIPVLLAPCGELRLVHPAGAPGASRAAARAGTVALVSTFSGSALDEVANEGLRRHWFQLYFLGGRSGARVLIERARDVGYKALVVTLDTPVIGKRGRDLRHRVSRPERLNLSTIVRFGPRAMFKPRWLARFARAGFPLGEPNCRELGTDGRELSMEEATAGWEAAKPTWSDLDWIREEWRGPIVLKGIMTATDARRALNAGANAVIVSNHGGRQLDAAPATADVLGAVVDAVGGDLEILVDGGVRRGSHVVRALALGARAVLIGRPFLYGLAVSGEAGVGDILELFRDEIVRTLALVGCPAVTELDRSWLGRSGELPVPIVSAN